MQGNLLNGKPVLISEFGNLTFLNLPDTFKLLSCLISKP